MLPFDHHHSKGDFPRTAVLYADIYSPQYLEIYQRLKELASEPDFNFVLRFIPGSKTGNPFSISGYGVELAVKNTEYQAVDDRDAVPESDDDSDGGSKPDRSSIFNEKTPSIQKLTPQERSEIAWRAICFAADSEDRLTTLTRISEDFPKLAHLLKKSPLRSKLANDAAEMIQTLTGDRQLLFLNGINFDTDSINAFGILREMRQENIVVSHLHKLGMNYADALDILSTPLAKTGEHGWGAAFNVQTLLSVWLNDLEKDSRYQQYHPTLYALLQGGHPQQFKFVRKNLYSVLFVLDLSKHQNLLEIFKLFEIIEQGIPIRFGFIPYLGENQSEVLTRCFYYIQEMDEGWLQEFIVSLSADETGDSVIDDETIKSVFKRVTGKDYSVISTETDGHVAMVRDFMSKFGLGPQGSVFMNGVYTAMSSEWSREVVTLYFEMMQYLTKLVFLIHY